MKKSEKKKHHVEHIVWEDHCGGAPSWKDVEEIKACNDEGYFIHSVGVVIAENKDRITMVQNFACNMMASHFMTIMKNCIKKRTKVSFINEAQ